MTQKSKILIIGGTGYVGKFVVEASVKAGHPTFALVRENTLLFDPIKGKLVQKFKNLGVTLLLVSIYIFIFFLRFSSYVRVCVFVMHGFQNQINVTLTHANH